MLPDHRSPSPPALPALAIRAGPRRRAPIGLTPLIDVVFILLLFFMLATSFGQWRFIEIITRGQDPARSVAAAAPAILINLRPDRILVSGQAVAEATLALALRDRPGRIERVILDVDPAVDVQRLIDTLEAIRQAGLPTPTLRPFAPHGD